MQKYRFLALAMVGVAIAGLPCGSAFATNILLNSGWDPTSIGAGNGGRNWTYTGTVGDGAYQLDDYYNVGQPPVNDGSLGFLKVEVGTGVGDFQFAQSDEYGATPGSNYTATVNGLNEYGFSVAGDEQGILKIGFLDSSHSFLAFNPSVVVLNSGSPAAYVLGSVFGVAPAGTAYVVVQVGLFNPSGDIAGHALFDNASLVPEPNSMMLILSGACAIGLARRFGGRTLS